MQEQVFQVTEALVNGIRRDNRTNRNTVFLTNAANIKPTEFGGSVHESVAWPYDASGSPLASSQPTATFPYPQIFQGKEKIIVATEDEIFLQTSISGTFNATATPLRYLKYDGATFTEKITNGTSFATWTPGIAGLGISDGNLVANAATGSQAMMSASVASGSRYRVAFKLSSVTSGSVYVGIGGQTTAAKNQDGTYVIDVESTSTASPTFEFTGFTGVVEWVSVRLVASVSEIPSNLETTNGWQFADFGNVWFLCNGKVIIAHMVLYGAEGTFLVDLLGNTSLSGLTICNYRNRLLIGGLDGTSTTFSATGFAAIWDAWIKYAPKDITTWKGIAIDKNFIFYSSPGGGDYEAPFVEELAVFSLSGYPDPISGVKDYATILPYVIDRVKNGEIGFIPSPVPGAIIRLQQLGGGLVSYSEGGIVSITPQSEDGLSIYDQQVVSRVGVSSPYHVGGSTQRHCFIDKADVLWTISGEGIKREGYSEYITTLTGPVVITHDPDLDEFYISNGTYGFTLGRTGMGKTDVFPTGIVYTESGLKSAVHAASAGTAWQIETDTFDMGDRSIKTIKMVEAAISDVVDDSVMVSIGFKFQSGSSSWNWTDWVVLTDEGFAWPVASGTDLRIRMKGTWSGSGQGKVDSLLVHWLKGDKRNVGGYLGKRG